ncbi:hypothetical protein V2S66_19180 [Streptomyces sp. V4-01]|uniref:Restriction endonuclease type IV Mrr domain-containing protein n=1 Tax=Actinacidiphila polyblastidii TaxID=3110430 RepID=A0ABU7PE45_9ACTN|nr:hypothetical protein [Streptomyces sp. V4-01]
MAHSAAPSGLVAVHIGVQNPAEFLEPHPDAHEHVRELWAAAHRYDGIGWEKAGADPRWLRADTSTCAAAINPSHFSGRGADEFTRFLDGAASRGEKALIIATMGDANSEPRNSIFGGDVASVYFRNFDGSIAGKRLGTSSEITLAPGLDPVDHDLALRIRNSSDDGPWWAMTPRPVTAEGLSGTTVYQPEGELVPILVDTLGEPVVARWMPNDGKQIWYIVPDGINWNAVVGWLVQRALPAHVPEALRRVRSPHSINPDLETTAESSARLALEELESHYAAEKVRLEAEQKAAKDAAEPVRSGLLFGTGSTLVDAVAVVLRAAGFDITDLDEELGTKSADLLAIWGGEARLVEVKSEGGQAKEALVADLERHLSTWPKLRPNQPVTRGTLVVNHQHKLDPAQRKQEVYERPEFVAALQHPVIPAMGLFEWWRTEDWAAVRTAVLGQHHGTEPSRSAPTEPETPAAARRNFWSRFAGS